MVSHSVSMPAMHLSYVPTLKKKAQPARFNRNSERNTPNPSNLPPPSSDWNSPNFSVNAYLAATTARKCFVCKHICCSCPAKMTGL